MNTINDRVRSILETVETRVTGVRKGITPVIAVLLLLMMTVAAAGGAYVWMQTFQEQTQEQTEDQVSDLQRGISIVDMQCLNWGDGTASVDVILRNSGDTELDLNPVDMDIYDQASGDLNVDISRASISLDADSFASGVSTSSGEDFSEPGSRAAYTINISDGSFVEGDNYNVEFIFTDENSAAQDQSCQAEAR